MTCKILLALSYSQIFTDCSPASIQVRNAVTSIAGSVLLIMTKSVSKGMNFMMSIVNTILTTSLVPLGMRRGSQPKTKLKTQPKKHRRQFQTMKY